MQRFFIVFGYGVPKDILVDEHYRHYLGQCFNLAYDAAVRGDGVTFILSGGPTDCFKPYRRTEAAELRRLLASFMSRPAVREVTRRWKVLTEPRSLSTLENLLNTVGMVAKRAPRGAAVTLLCEHTRRGRVAKLGRRIFGKRYRPTIHSIDFDISSNRYLEPEFIATKERRELRHSLWALRSSKNLKAHRQFFRDKLAFFRAAPAGNHAKVVEQWWRLKMVEYERMM